MSPPDTQAPRDAGGGSWRRPQMGVTGLERYFRTLQERLPLIVMVTFVTTLAAVLYLVVWLVEPLGEEEGLPELVPAEGSMPAKS